jgi:hypothetical protein
MGMDSTNAMNAINAGNFLVHPPTPRHRMAADSLRGRMSYEQHYGYLLDWYMNDRNGWHAGARAAPGAGTGQAGGMPGAAGAGSSAFAEAHFKDSLRDVVEALKHLENRVNCVSERKPVVRKARRKARGIERLFTRLVDRRRIAMSPNVC